MTGPEKMYETGRAVVDAMVEDATQHRASCDDGPLCIGPGSVQLIHRFGASTRAGYLVMAIGLLRDERGRTAELERMLEVQRGLTADAAARAMGLDADLVDAHGQIAGLELKLAAALAELTAWEESADVIGPVLPVADHG